MKLFRFLAVLSTAVSLQLEYRQFHHDTPEVRHWMRSLESKIGPGITQNPRVDVYLVTGSDEVGAKLAERTQRITPEIKTRVAVDEASGAEAFDKRVGAIAKEDIDKYVEAKRYSLKKERTIFRLGVVIQQSEIYLN